MAKILTTDALVKTALRRAMIPKDQATFTSDDIQDILNEELGIHVIPMVLRAHEEYFVVDEDSPLVDGTARYKIPYRATGNKLRDVQYIDSGGSQYEMTRISLEDRSDYQGNYATNYNTNYARAFYLENDDVVLMQNHLTSGNLRMSYFLRPNELVEDARGATVTVITDNGDGTTTFTLSSFPVHFQTTTVFDFVQGKSPNKIVGFDRDVLSFDATAQTITFSDSELKTVDLSSTTPKAMRLAVGDIITKAEETIVPQLPTELHPILAQKVAVKMLEALGDTQGMTNAQQELERMEKNAMTLIDNRVDGAPVKINNRHSILKSSGRRGSF